MLIIRSIRKYSKFEHSFPSHEARLVTRPPEENVELFTNFKNFFKLFLTYTL